MSTSKYVGMYLEWQEMSDVRLWPSKFASNAFLQKIAKLQLFQHNFATQVYVHSMLRADYYTNLFMTYLHEFQNFH